MFLIPFSTLLRGMTDDLINVIPSDVTHAFCTNEYSLDKLIRSDAFSADRKKELFTVLRDYFEVVKSNIVKVSSCNMLQQNCTKWGFVNLTVHHVPIFRNTKNCLSQKSTIESCLLPRVKLQQIAKRLTASLAVDLKSIITMPPNYHICWKYPCQFLDNCLLVTSSFMHYYTRLDTLHI